MRLYKTAQIIPRSILPILPLVRIHLAKLGIILRILPRLAGKILDGAIARGEDGQVLGCVVQALRDRIEVSGQLGEDVYAFCLWEDV